MPITENSVLLEDKMDVVSLTIRIGGEKISRQYHVVTATILEEINKIPTATLVIVDGEASKQDFPIESSGDFAPGKKIEISLGYLNDDKDDSENFLFTGIIVTVASKVNNNCCELSIECKDEAIKMTINKSNAYFDKNITASQVAEQVLNKNQIEGAEVDPVKIKHEQIVQSNMTDWDFMIGRIDAVGLICVIHNGKINIRELKVKEQTEQEKEKMLTLMHGKNILEFNADKDSRIRNQEVKTVSWDFKEQKIVEGTNTDSVVEGKDTESKPVTSGFEMRSPVHMTKEEADAIAKTKKIKQDLSGIKGKVKYTGRVDKQVLPGDFVQIAGVGKSFEGYHFVSAVQQLYEDGSWITEATLGWNEQFFSEQTSPQHPASATGQPSSIQGLQIGIVTSIEDSEGQYRVQVKFPSVDEKGDGIHARVATLDAGNKRGTFFRPEIDDEVVVGFINDDPSHPVILGMMHSSAKAAPLEPEKENNLKGFVSRSEIKLLFDDDKSSVIIQTPGQRVFEMDDDSGTITLKDADGNKVVMKQNSIAIEASKEIKIKAGTSLSIEAMNISIKADTSLEAKGSASAKLEGGGMTEIKGGLVKIN
jgi:Rhs element Vgr protein